MGKHKRKLRVGDKVWYAIPKDIEREWTITGILDVTDGTQAYLCRPDEEKQLKIDRCNAYVEKCVLVT
jgi:hypothetical protein